MFGIRRYRLFLLVTALTIGTLYHLFGSRRHDDPSYVTPKTDPVQEVSEAKPAQVAEPPAVVPPPVVPIAPEVEKPPKPGNDAAKTSQSQPPKPALPTLGKIPAAQSSSSSSSTTSSAWERTPTISGDELLKQQTGSDFDDFREEGLSREDDSHKLRADRQSHWSKPKAQFPLKSDEIIPLPSGKEKVLPKIQAKFSRESSSQKKDRLSKLATIRESFRHAWNGYKQYGLPHDELKPISKSSADPFMGWGATLVDSLDTMWIMGLKDEFDEAVKEVAKIDFTTANRKDIPLFETVIRYLGGLISAWDLSGHRHPALINQAEALAEVLMGAFDTPNRMPIPFYIWSPSYTSQAHRSSAHIVMAELGSLSMEFTRLAQLTGKNVYYDAVARITNELEKWQMETAMPGLWPLRLDASGCKKTSHTLMDEGESEDQPVLMSEDELSATDPIKGEEPAIYSRESDHHDTSSNMNLKREVVGLERPKEQRSPPYRKIEPILLEVDCEPQGLSAEPHATSEKFGIGGQADSTYEYFPKMYALLGSQVQQYKTMYLDSMRAIRKQLLFRPMIKDEKWKILFAANHELHKKVKGTTKKEVKYEVTHLSCFAGGMFALGSKLFDLKEDMELAKQLTDGCVWAYQSMPNGVMAEDAALVACDSLEPCAWNETKWHESLDPNLKERFAAVDTWNRNQRKVLEQSEKEALQQVQKGSSSLPEQTAAPTAVSEPQILKRSDDLQEAETPSKTSSSIRVEDDDHGTTSAGLNFVPKVALPHEKNINARIQEERLPPGYTSIFDPHYGLRPEAIESVFYMYRTTGDEEWRTKGWQMFEAIQRVTQTEAGNAAIKDVTSHLSVLEDKMESFWLAETLKYFYLLFSEPSLISLDDYVLNTEAHPFKLPK